MRVVSTNSVGELQLARARLDLVHQRLAVALAPEVRMHGQRRELADLLLGKRVQRGAADDRAVVLGDDEALDLGLQPLARAAHQNALLLERLDDREDAADVVDRRAAQVRERRRRDHRAHAVAREELEQQRAVEVAADEVRALDAVVAGADRARQVVLDVRRAAWRRRPRAAPRRRWSTARSAAAGGRCARPRSPSGTRACARRGARRPGWRLPRARG